MHPGNRGEAESKGRGHASPSASRQNMEAKIPNLLQIHPNSPPPPDCGRAAVTWAGRRAGPRRAGARSLRRPVARARGAVTSDAVGAGLAARHLGPCVEAAEARRRERPAAFAGAR